MKRAEQVTGTLTAPAPDGWFHKESITVLAPDGQANVIASSEPLDPTLSTTQYAMIQGDLLREEFPGYIEYSFDGAPVFGAGHGYIREFSWTPPDGLRVRQIQLYLVHGGRGYTATATATQKGFPSHEKALRQILGGLVVRT